MPDVVFLIDDRETLIMTDRMPEMVAVDMGVPGPPGPPGPTSIYTAGNALSENANEFDVLVDGVSVGINDDNKLEVIQRPYDVGLFIEGNSADLNKTRRHVIARAMLIPGDFAGSQAWCANDDGAERVFVVKKNGAQVGTITFAASAQTGTFEADTPATDIIFAVGDRLEITIPAALGDMTEISITFLGYRT
jgi:hypothetical protein